MSGLYVDVPGNRMAFHRDGSVGFKVKAGVVTVLSAGNLQTINDESDATVLSVDPASNAGTQMVGLIFPELRDLAGYFTFWRNVGAAPGLLETSVDTTTGVDGTWTTLVNPWVNASQTALSYRTAINAISASGKKGIRWSIAYTGSGNDYELYTLHVYGKPTAGQIRYLLFTDTGGTEVTGPYFDFGDDPRGGAVEVKTFKIKNGHPTLSANTITLSCSTLTDKSPSFADDYTFSSDGTTYTATLAVGTLAAGASSGTLYVKRTTPIGAALGLEAPLFSAVAASWT